MSLTLYTDTANFRAFKILIAAEYNGVEIAIPEFTLGKDNKTDQFKQMSPLGKLPVLNTPSGSIFESNAIARYVARMRRDTELYGCSFFESAQVDSWIDFCSHDLELPATVWIYPVMGLLPYSAATASKAKTDFARALAVLEAHLVDKTYLVGNKITLADITVATTLVYPFKFVADASYRSAFPNTMRWFDTCVNQPQFEAVIGSVVLCTQEIVPAGGDAAPAQAAGGNNNKGGNKKEKKEKAPKQPKQPKAAKKEKKDEPAAAAATEEEAPKPAKKEEHPFKVMDKTSPSSFVMDTWKKTYSNCETYEAAMTEFWSTVDAEGWSLWRGDYQFDNENSVLFMTSNLIGGFMQRTEEIRKWLFGTLTIRGTEGPGTMKITAYFLIRGQEIKPLQDCNPDAEYYTWTKMSLPASDADKALLFEYWTSDSTLEGEPCLDSRCYK